MMENSGKFQYMLLAKRKPLKIEIEGFQLQSVKSVNLLGITIDYNIRRLVQKLKASAELEMPWMKNRRNYYITLLFCHSLTTAL